MRLTLKRARMNKGFTQKQLADALKVKLSTYRTWEQGTVKLTLENTCAISEILNCTPNDICGWYDDHPHEDRGEYLTSEEREIVGCYRESTFERKKSLMQTARDSADMSKEIAKRGVSATKRMKAI